jgi:hypothetical protein
VMISVGPGRKVESVARELHDGLRDGSVELESAETPYPESERNSKFTPAPTRPAPRPNAPESTPDTSPGTRATDLETTPP